MGDGTHYEFTVMKNGAGGALDTVKMNVLH